MGIRLHIRPGDCDAFGHVNNSVYLAYIQDALAQTLGAMGFAQDWRAESNVLWQMKTITIDYRQAAVFGDMLQASLWLEYADPMHPRFGCEIIKREYPEQHAIQTIARTLTEWQRISKTTGEPTLLPSSMLNAFPRTKGSMPRSYKQPGDDETVRRYTWEHKVRRSEVGSGDYVHPQAIYTWLEEAVFEATAESGWPPEKRRKFGRYVFQRHHDTSIFRYPRAGDSIQVISRLVKTQKMQGTWLQEIILPSESVLCVRDYSTGIFVNTQGQPSSPPPQMIQDIQAAQ